MNNPAALVTLRTGAEVPGILISTVGITLQRLYDTDPVALYKLAKIAEDPDHQPFGNAGRTLLGYGMIQPDGSMHSTTREIVRASVAIEDANIQMVNPLA